MNALSCENECQSTKQKLNESENNAYFDFTPSTFFKVMVNGCHFENALAVGKLVVNGLQKRRKQLHNVNRANKEEQERLLGLEDSSHNQCSQKE